jgi:hypothetical protein
MTQNKSLRIGWDELNVAYRWGGLVDDVGVYTRAWTSNEVSEAYAAGLGKPLTSMSAGTNGLVGYVKLDDGLASSSATQAVDTVRGVYWIGTAIGSGDWTNGIVPQ